jgi:DNA-binding NarL/FixJ family response regulator
MSTLAGGTFAAGSPFQLVDIIDTGKSMKTSVCVSAPPIRVVLIDDHEVVRHGLAALMEAQPGFEVVGEAGTAADGIRRVAFDEPDVVVLDLDLPDGSGVEVCRRIQSVSPRSRVMILTAYADPAALVAAREAGAGGFVLKRVQNFDLIERIRRVASGGTAFDGAPPVGATTPRGDPLLARLTDREYEVLALMADGKTNHEIADELFLAEKTVKNYVSSVLVKMGMSHRAGAAAHLAAVRARSAHMYPPSDWGRDVSVSGVRSDSGCPDP